MPIVTVTYDELATILSALQLLRQTYYKSVDKDTIPAELVENFPSYFAVCRPTSNKQLAQLSDRLVYDERGNELRTVLTDWLTTIEVCSGGGTRDVVESAQLYEKAASLKRYLDRIDKRADPVVVQPPRAIVVCDEGNIVFVASNVPGLQLVWLDSREDADSGSDAFLRINGKPAYCVEYTAAPWPTISPTTLGTIQQHLDWVS